MSERGSGLGYFRDDYFAARDLFRATCEASDIPLSTHEHSIPGPRGELLTTDCALIGREDASRLVVVISGTHGVETLCGSACQSGFIAEGTWRSLREDTSVLLIHALNCWGAAHLRRNNEDNVDLNRNFFDFRRTPPTNPGYEELHEAVSCSQYRGADRDRANGALAEYLAANGPGAYIAALMGGQYQHPDGMGYGGDAPTWSRQVLTSILAPFSEHARQVFVVEYHSGLGPYGYGMAVTMQTGDELRRVQSRYGEWVHAPNEPAGHGEQPLHAAPGHSTEGFRACLPEAELTAIVLEYGTYPPDVSLPLLLDDHWLTYHGRADTPERRAIKQRLLEVHYPADHDWRQAVWDRSVQVMDQTLRGLR